MSGLTNATLYWSVNGIAGGNATFGKIGVAGSSPCQIVTSSATSQVIISGGRDSLAKSFFDRRHQRQQFLAQRFHAGYVINHTARAHEIS